MKKIVSWVIEVEWEDGTFEKIADISDLTAQYVDGYLAYVEEERNNEAEAQEIDDNSWRP